MDPLRRTALLTGVFFVITYLTSISAKLYFYAPLSKQDNYILGAGPDNLLLWGALNEVVLVAANIASAVVIFPVLKRQSEALALGFVTARVMESVFISVGILSVLTIVTLRQDHAGADGEDEGRAAGVEAAVEHRALVVGDVLLADLRDLKFGQGGHVGISGLLGY